VEQAGGRIPVINGEHRLRSRQIGQSNRGRRKP
jgi:hypothetical protein